MSEAVHMSADEHSLWEPRRTLTLEAARRHSMRVRIMRVLLLFLALIAVAALVWEFWRQPETDFEEPVAGESVKMINPRYSGRTEDGLPFFLTAKEAVRPTINQETVQLINPVLEFYRQSSTAKSIVIAESGVYNDAEKTLELRTSVDLKTDDGYSCQTTHARVYTKTKNIEGDEPISCTGQFGKVNGNAFEIKDNYETFIFKNGMQAVLEDVE